MKKPHFKIVSSLPLVFVGEGCTNSVKDRSDVRLAMLLVDSLFSASVVAVVSGAGAGSVGVVSLLGFVPPKQTKMLERIRKRNLWAPETSFSFFGPL